ncbi:alpha/beta hydrolase [Catenulispora sp. GP43]|uniref:alpha/beta hydrolase n=1 Tax=Catenulispora sp. GP43 TaxID=3156263 RepID=UPI003516640A
MIHCKALRSVFIGVSCLALIGVEGPSAAAAPVDPYGTLGAQHLDWQVCDWYAHPAPGGPDWSQYPVTYCADITVPMDWYDPSKGTISVRVTRVPGNDGSARRGILMVDPGGPGSDGSTLATKTAKSEPALLSAYDIIGFAPRGVAPSTTLDCGIDWSKYTPVADERDRSPATTALQLADARLVGQSCGAAPLAPYITTDQTIRDMDLIRALLGEPKVDYLGFSYGTWLGAWYAATFPARTDRFALDSNMDWRATIEDDYVDAWARGFDRRFEVQFLPWLARHDDLYGFGATAEQAQASYDALRAAVAAQGRGSSLDLSQAQALYNADGWPQWAGVLKALRAGPTQATTLLPEVRVPTGKANSGAYWAVTCADTPWSHDPGYWVAEGDRLGAAYPLVGAESTEEPCAFYPHTSQHPVSPGADNLPRMLMVQDQYDPATPIEGALEDAQESDQAMVFVRDGGNHIAYDTGNACVDAHVNDYLLDGGAPTSAVCEAMPLPLDDKVYPQRKPQP